MIIFIGELMKQAERYIGEGLHPRVIVEVRWRGQCQRCRALINVGGGGVLLLSPPPPTKSILPHSPFPKQSGL